jgi:hypothetical protein
MYFLCQQTQRKVRHDTRYNVLAEVIQALVVSAQSKPSGVMTGLLQGKRVNGDTVAVQLVAYWPMFCLS